MNLPPIYQKSTNEVQYLRFCINVLTTHFKLSNIAGVCITNSNYLIDF